MAVMAGLVTGPNGRMATAPISAVVRAVSRARSWLSARHSLRAELLVVVGLYVLYESTRGIVAGRGTVAVQHAYDVVSIERSLHLFVEHNVQHAAGDVPGLAGSLGAAYAAMPSMHTGYAIIVGASVFREARHLVTRLAALAYPAFVALVIVATGNHFLLDAAAGAAVAALAALMTSLLMPARTRVPTPHRSPLTGSSGRRRRAVPVSRRAAGIGLSPSCPS